MPVRIRLQRHGKKGKPFYWIVAADGRSKRDGKFLEKLGIYNPNTNPATIEVDVDGSVKWLQNGAQPSETAKRILSYKGVLLKHHLLGGVRKGALTEEQVEKKFNAWLEEKEKSVAEKTKGLDKSRAEEKAKALEAEKEVSEKRALAAVESEAEEVAEAEVPEGVAEPVEGGDASEESGALETATEPDTDIKEETSDADDKTVSKEESATGKQTAAEETTKEKETAAEETTKGEETSAEETADLEEVVETPEIPHPDRDNADTTPIPTVVEKEVLEDTEGIAEAPSVQEVITDSDFEEKDEEKPKPSAEEE